MTKMTETESAIAWGWVLEILASSKNVTVSLLQDLIAQIPPNLSADLRRSIGERVALRCLEDLFAAHDSPPPPPVRRSKLALDFSESCQEVLRRIVNETVESDVKLGGGGKWKWDIEPYINHKKARMPKCALNKLKDSIVDGSHPYAELFRIKSGLGSDRVGGSDDVLRFNGGCSKAPNTGVEEERNVDSGLHSKSSRIASETGKVDNGSGVNAKKMKRDASYAVQSAEDNSVPFVGRDMLENSSRRDVPVSRRGRCLLSEFEMDLREERWGLEDGCDDYTALKRSGDAIRKSGAENPCADKAKEGSWFSPEPTTSCVSPPHETQHKASAKDPSCNIEHEFHIEVPHPVSVGGSKQTTIADEGNDDSEHCPELKSLPVPPPDKAHNKVFANESDCISEHDSDINIARRASSYVSPKKTIADGVKDYSSLDYVAMEKHDFLNSKCTSTRYFNSTRKDHCLMCNGGGQLLICTTSDCPLVYHESCMGSEFISYENGDFYCPFCAYSLHLTEFLEVEKDTYRLRKDLNTFICVLGCS